MWVPSNSSSALSGTHSWCNTEHSEGLCVDGCAAVLTPGQGRCTAACLLTGCLKTSAMSSHPKILQHTLAILFLNLSLSDSSSNQFSNLNACDQIWGRLKFLHCNSLCQGYTTGHHLQRSLGSWNRIGDHGLHCKYITESVVDLIIAVVSCFLQLFLQKMAFI